MQACIDETERRRAAQLAYTAELEFEKAAELRDKMLVLEKQVLLVREG